MRKLFSSLLSVAMLVSFPVISFGYGVIDFEMDGAQDDMFISDQFYASHGLTFGLDLNGDRIADEGAFPSLERVGHDGTDGFLNDPISQHDVARSGFEKQLGNFFLKTTSGVQNQQGNIPSLMIMYNTGTSEMSGEIWDIDGTPALGTEKWLIEALGKNGELLDTLESPEYFNREDATSLNGAPFEWSFKRPTADIYAIRLAFAGTKLRGTGLAFNNFSPYSAVPETGTMFMLGSGLIGIAALLRKRCR